MGSHGSLIRFIRQLLLLAAVIWLIISLNCEDSRKPTLSGRVLDCLTGEPVSKALVSIGRCGRSISTTRSGHYRFFDLPPGTCIVLVEAPEHRPVSEFVVLSRGRAKYSHFVLEPHENSETGICGVLWDDSTGEPLPYVAVSLPEKHWKTYTNTDGYFKFLDLEPGTLFYSVHRIGDREVAGMARLQEMDMHILSLGLRGGPEQWVCSSETYSCAISGRVVDAITGQAVRSAQIRMPGSDRTFVSDGNGFYCIGMLPQGQCTLRVFKKGAFEDAMVTVPLRKRALEVNVALMPETGTLRGSVVDGGSGLACAASRVECMRQGHSHLLRRCDEAGAFSFEDLPVGPWSIRAGRPGYRVSVADSVFVVSDETTFVGLGLERLEEARSARELTVAAARGEIHGYVSCAQTESSLPGAQVWIEELRIGAASDASGFYRIDKVPPGRHLLQVRFIGFEDFTIEVDVSPGQSKRLDIVLKQMTIEVDRPVD